jgi:hypothetical protein
VHQYQQSFEHSSNADFNRPVEYLYIVLPAVRGNTISDPRPHRQRPRTALPTSEKRQRERSRGCGFCAASHMSRMMLWCPPGEFQCLARACYAQYFCEFANAMLPYRSLSKDDCSLHRSGDSICHFNTDIRSTRNSVSKHVRRKETSTYNSGRSNERRPKC